MLTIAFICLLIVAVISGVVFCLFDSNREPVNLAIKLCGVLSCIVLSVVSANLNSVIGSFSLFVILGLCFMMIYQMFISLRPDQPTKTYFYIKGTFRGLANLLIAIGGLTLIPFSPWGLLFGIFIGFMIFFINLPFKEHYKVEIWYSTILAFCTSGMIIGQAITLLIKSSLILAGCLILISGLCLLASNFTKIYAHKNKFAKYSSRILFILGLIFISMSIYFI